MSGFKVAGIFAGISLVTLILTTLVGRWYVSSGYIIWLLFVLIPIGLIALAAALLALFFGILDAHFQIYLPLKQSMLTRYGVRTDSIVLSSSEVYDREDACLGGIYKYSDSRGQEYEFKFEKCIHWPSNEQWDLVEQGYSNGATNAAYYLQWFPRFHFIQWPI